MRAVSRHRSDLRVKTDAGKGPENQPSVHTYTETRQVENCYVHIILVFHGCVTLSTLALRESVASNIIVLIEKSCIRGVDILGVRRSKLHDI